MATQTTNLGLTKPGYDEAADIVPAVNNNMDTLDAKIGAVPANTSVQAQITSNSQAIGNLDNLTTTEKGSLVGAANELNSKIANKLLYVSAGENVTLSVKNVYRTGNVVMGEIVAVTSSTKSAYGTIATIKDTLAQHNVYMMQFGGDKQFYIDANSGVIATATSLPAGTYRLVIEFIAK